MVKKHGLIGISLKLVKRPRRRLEVSRKAERPSVKHQTSLKKDATKKRESHTILNE